MRVGGVGGGGSLPLGRRPFAGPAPPRVTKLQPPRAHSARGPSQVPCPRRPARRPHSVEHRRRPARVPTARPPPRPLTHTAAHHPTASSSRPPPVRTPWTAVCWRWRPVAVPAPCPPAVPARRSALPSLLRSNTYASAEDLLVCFEVCTWKSADGVRVRRGNLCACIERPL